MPDGSEHRLRTLRVPGRLRGLILVTSTLALIISGFLVGATITHAASYCQVTYAVTNQWQGGFGANITVQNTSSAAWTN